MAHWTVDRELRQLRRRRKRKRHVKNEFALFQSSSLLFHLPQFVKCWRIFLELNSKGLYPSSEKEKRKSLSCVHVLHARNEKLGSFTSQSCNDGKERYEHARCTCVLCPRSPCTKREIRKLHVAVVQRRQRKVRTRVLHVCLVSTFSMHETRN